MNEQMGGWTGEEGGQIEAVQEFLSDSKSILSKPRINPTSRPMRKIHRNYKFRESWY